MWLHHISNHCYFKNFESPLLAEHAPVPIKKIYHNFFFTTSLAYALKLYFSKNRMKNFHIISSIKELTTIETPSKDFSICPGAGPYFPGADCPRIIPIN